MMKINQCKTEDDINEYFREEDQKLWKEKFGFVFGEMDNIWAYGRERQKLIERCGDRMVKLKERKR